MRKLNLSISRPRDALKSGHEGTRAGSCGPSQRIPVTHRSQLANTEMRLRPSLLGSRKTIRALRQDTRACIQLGDSQISD
jgi:hypothetical protein